MVPGSTIVHAVEGAPKNGCCQCLCPQGEPQLPPASLQGNSPTPVGRSGPGSYQITAFSLGSRTCQILCAPFKSQVSVSPSPLSLRKLSLADLQSQMLWGLVFLVLDSWAAEPDVGPRTLTPVGEPLQYNDSPVCGLPTPWYGT